MKAVIILVNIYSLGVFSNFITV